MYGKVTSAISISVDDIEPYDFDFEEITNGQLVTPDAIFDVVGDVNLIENSRKRRDHHHHHHNHCHFHSHHDHHSYCQYNSHHHSHHNHHHSSSSSTNFHCMSNLNSQHSGFTTSMNVNYGHNHNGNCHLYSNGGNLQNHQGASLSYNTHTSSYQFHVSTDSHSWTVNAPCPQQPGNSHNVATSWHPQTGAHVYVNNQLLGTCGHGTPHTTPHTQTVDLRIGDGHVTINIDVNINITINGLNMFPTSATRLQSAGVSSTSTTHVHFCQHSLVFVKARGNIDTYK